VYTSQTSELIFGYGHQNIQATHKTTLEFTKDLHLSKKGDCIISVAASKALADLNTKFKEKLRESQAKLSILIEVDDLKETVHAKGSPQLILSNTTDIVIRKSGFICDRTLAIHADKAAQDLSRDLVERMKNPRQKVKTTFTVKV
jgi:uncharacterized protein